MQLWLIAVGNRDPVGKLSIFTDEGRFFWCLFVVVGIGGFSFLSLLLLLFQSPTLLLTKHTKMEQSIINILPAGGILSQSSTPCGSVRETINRCETIATWSSRGEYSTGCGILTPIGKENRRLFQENGGIKDHPRWTGIGTHVGTGTPHSRTTPGTTGATIGIVKCLRQTKGKLRERERENSWMSLLVLVRSNLPLDVSLPARIFFY